MTEINRLVLDLSHHEKINSWDAIRASGIHGIIYKATQGQSYHDDTYHKSKEKALKAGMLWGSYHFADGTDVVGQISNYLSYASPQKDEIFCLDLEDYGSNSMNLDQARVFVEKVEHALGRNKQCLLYSGNRIKELLGSRKSSFWGARRLWLAQYGTTPKVQASWENYWLWQYSDGEFGPEPHDVGGTSDAVDSNHFDGTPEELRAQWSGGEASPIQPLVVKVAFSVPPGVKVEITGL